MWVRRNNLFTFFGYIYIYLYHIGTVTNVHRQNKTTMLFRLSSGTIPKNTVSVNIELKFQRQKGYTGVRLGMADNLKLTIQQK